MSASRRNKERELIRRELKRIRLEAGLRQVDLATELDVPQSFIAKIENGERKVEFIDVRNICRACGFDLAEFAQKIDREILYETPEPINFRTDSHK